jgi:hypothetical protein
MTQVPIIQKGAYRHSKSGKLYEVIGIAEQTESYEVLVIYRPLYDHDFVYELFARPYEMFIGNVELDGKIVPRFQKVNE